MHMGVWPWVSDWVYSAHTCNSSCEVVHKSFIAQALKLREHCGGRAENVRDVKPSSGHHTAASNMIPQ